jgi:hypothetical protein
VGRVAATHIRINKKSRLSSTRTIRHRINKKKKMDGVAGLWDESRPKNVQLGCRLNNEMNLAHVPEKWIPVFREGHAPTQESRAHPSRDAL